MALFNWDERLALGLKDIDSQHAYPDMAAHKKEHDDLVNQALKLTKDFEEGKLTITMDLLKFLQKWVTDHIKGTDKKYAPFFKGKGIQ